MRKPAANKPSSPDGDAKERVAVVKKLLKQVEQKLGGKDVKASLADCTWRCVTRGTGRKLPSPSMEEPQQM